jgi:curved DNA-binding protein CbpA
MGDYYKALELEKGATGDEIKANYRRLAMKWHPDRNQGSAEAEERFKSISEAYSVLSDEVSRREYDARLDYEAAGGTWQQQPGAGYQQGFAGGAGRGFSGFGQGFARGFSREQAADMFMNEMYNLAIELTMQNVGWRDIAAELVRRGCPDEAAQEIARKIEKRRKEMIRGNARPYFLRSAVSGFFGFCIFALFGGVGLGILGFFGLLMLLSGGYNLVRAIYFMTTGNAPRSLI